MFLAQKEPHKEELRMTDNRQGTGMEIPFNQILDNIHDAVVTLDTEWRVTYLNRAAAQFAGRPVEELLGKSTWDIFPHAFGNVFYNELHGAAADRQAAAFRTILSQHRSMAGG